MDKKGQPVEIAGQNLPDFRETQLAFAAHIRNPEVHPRPADVPDRRMAVYRELFYNNIEGFLAGAFPVAKKILGDEQWHKLARLFVHKHPSESPYFLEISQEFLAFLDHQSPPGLPPFMLELCHYEWVELSLQVDEREIPQQGINPDGDLMADRPCLSPLIWVLSYRFPVHQLSPDFQPAEPPAGPSHLVVYRDPADKVRFMESNPLTHRLLGLLDGLSTGAQAVEQIVNEIADETGAEAADLDADAIRRAGAEALTQLRMRTIITGTSLVTA